MTTYTTDQYGNTYADGQFQSGPGGPGTPAGGPDSTSVTGVPVGQVDPNPMGSTPGQAAYAGGAPPATPGFNSPWQNSFAMEPFAQQQMAGINIDTTGLTRYQQEANRTGPSSWAGLATKSAQDNAKTARNQASLDAAGGVAQADSGLAMRGGLDSGARERVALGGANAYDTASQGISNGLMTNENNINTTDEANRIQMLGNEGAVQNQYLQPQFQKAQVLEGAQAADVQGQQNAIQAKNSFNMGEYQTQGAIYGANQNSAATAQQSKGNWVMTALSKRHILPKDMRECLTAIRFVGAELEPRLTVFYFQNGPELVARMEAGGADWANLLVTVHQMCDLVRSGETEAALRTYVMTITKLMDQYWPECTHRAVVSERKKRIKRIEMLGKLPVPRLMGGKLASQCGGDIPQNRFEM